MRKLAFISIFLTAITVLCAQYTNLYCVVCGKGPLTGRYWVSKWGPVCDDCYHLPDHCSICGLPVKDGDGHIKTPDGRLICRFDKTNAVMTIDQAKDLFEQTREDVVDMYGPKFALKYPDVTVRLFDVDYWSERGMQNGLHKFGFASTRKTADGVCTHEVVMLSGRTHDEMVCVAAHEYTHLWINENRPSDRVIDTDTIEAICELTAYKLMQEKNMPDMEKHILENPYTNGKIKTLVAVEREGGIDYIMNWVINGKTETFDEDGDLQPIPAPDTPEIFYRPRVPSQGLKFNGILMIGADREAVINGVTFDSGEEKSIKLRNKSVSVHCMEIHDDHVVVELDGSTQPVVLPKGKETLPP